MAQGTDVTKRSGPPAASGGAGNKSHAGLNGKAPTIEVPPRVTGIHGMLGIHPALLAIVAAGVLYPLIASPYWTFNVTVGMVLALACLGLLVVVGWGREISLAQAGLTGAALYISGYLSRGDQPGVDGPGLEFPLAAAGGIAFTVGVSCLVAVVSMRLSGVYVIVLTLSLQFLLENSLFTEAKLTGGLSGLSTPRPEFFGMSMQGETRFYYFTLGVLLVSMVFLYRFRHCRFGRSLLMVGSDKAAAAAVGVSPWMYKVAAFGIAGFFAGLAGAMSAPLYGNPPGTLQYISFNSLFYLAIPILAGFESLMAVAGVAIFFTVLPQILLDQNINIYLLGGIGLGIGVLAGPRGMGGAVIDLFDPRARAKRREAKSGGGGGKSGSGSRAKSSSGSPAPGRAKSSQLGTKRPASAGSEKK